MIESPFVDYCDKIDEKMVKKGASLDDYNTLAYDLFKNTPTYILDLLISDFKFRAKFRKNVIMSVEGEQAEGKSLFSLYFAYTLGDIFGKKFDINKHLYAIPEDLDSNIRESPFRTTHFLDEQRNKNVGVGSITTDLNLMDYEEQSRWTMRNIIYASPKVRNHAHYFVFKVQRTVRIENKKFCSRCPSAIQDKCYKNQFKTCCPNNFIKENNGQKVKFYERSGYPSYFTALLKTKRKFDGWEVPRGFLNVPIVNPKTVELYDKIKGKNIARLEAQEDDSFLVKNKLVDSFIKEKKDQLIKLVGAIKVFTYKVRGEEGTNLIEKPVDSRKWVVVPLKVIEAELYMYIKAQHRYTVREVDIMVSLIKNRLETYAQEKNSELYKEKVLNTKKE